MNTKPTEVFSDGLNKGHILVKNGKVTTTQPPIVCTPNSAIFDFARLFENEEAGDVLYLYLSYRKNGGKLQTMKFPADTYDEGTAYVFRTEQKDSVAFAVTTPNFNPEMPVLPTMKIEGLSMDYELGENGLDYTVVNDVGNGPVMWGSQTVDTPLHVETTELTFYQTPDIPPLWDMFNLITDASALDSFTVMSCAAVKIENNQDTGPISGGITPPATEYDDASNVTTFTTVNEGSESGELPFTLKVEGDMRTYEVRDADTGQVLATQAGVNMVPGVTVGSSNSFGEVYFARTDGSTTRRFIVTGRHSTLRIIYGEGNNDGGPIAFDGGVIQPIELEIGNPQLTDSAPGSFVIEKMSTLVEQFIFNTGDAELTVPDKIPSTITTFNDMFKGASRFNQDLSGWLTTNVNWMINMFQGAISFNGDVTNWDVSNVEGMWNMFNGCAKFNQNISRWDTSSCNDMDHMFAGCSVFNQPIGNWEMGLVEYCTAMFRNCKYFNQPIGNWNLSSCEYFDEMFYGAERFNQDISGWDVGTATDMEMMFFNAFSFNQDLSSWCVSNFTEMPYEFDVSAMAWWMSRPVWGTCSSGGVIVPPPVDDTSLKFTLNSDDTDDGAKPFTISLKNPGWGWKVLADGVTIASSDFTSPNITKTTETWDGNVTVLNINNVRGAFNVYEVVADADYVKLTAPFIATGVYAKYVEIIRFGSTIRSHRFNLYGASLIGIPQTLPSYITNLDNMFEGCSHFNLDLSGWDTSRVTSMRSTFSSCNTFNGNIGNWIVSNVTDFTYFLEYCESFNQDLSGWDVTGAPIKLGMFSGCSSFNQPIGNWNMFGSTDIRRILQGCTAFNQPLAGWDTSTVVQADWALEGCASFNRDINNWNTSSFTGMNGFFGGCTIYNQPLFGWDMSNVTDISGMFKDCVNFNQDISMWDVSSVGSMSYLFSGCTIFNQDIGNWNVSNVYSLAAVFKDCVNFDQDISGWRPSRNTSLESTFENALVFNQDISDWDVSNVEDWGSSFAYAAAFNQDLSWWCVSQENFPPSDWAIGTVRWGLPKPAWGTCPRGEDVGTGDTFVKPPQPTGGMVWTQGSVSQNYPIEIHIKLKGVVGEWSLHHGRYTLVSSTKTGNYIDVYEDLTAGTLEIQLHRPMIQTFRFVGQVDEILFEVYDPRDSSVATGFFEVVQFSETIKTHKFHLPDLVLTLPNEAPVLPLTDMAGMFEGCNRFNVDIGHWDTSLVTTMRAALKGCTTFNQDLSGWDTHSVKSMIDMFYGCEVFNQDLSSWCVDRFDFTPPGFTTNCFMWTLPKPIWGTCPGKVSQPFVPDQTSDVFVLDVSISDARYNNLVVRVDVTDVSSDWAVVDSATGNVICSPSTGDNVTDVNPSVAKSAYWLKSSGAVRDSMRVEFFVTSLEPKRYEIRGAGSNLQVSNSSQLFDHYSTGAVTVRTWSTRIDSYRFHTGNMDLMVPEYLPPNVTTLEEMFRYCNRFSQDLHMWNTSNVTNMKNCFHKNFNFNGRLDGWDVSNVTTFEGFLSGYEAFNRLYHGRFNQDLSMWNVSNATNMTQMFTRQVEFNQDLSGWCVPNFTQEPEGFSDDTWGWTLPKPVWGTCPTGGNNGGATPTDGTALVFEVQGTGYLDVYVSNPTSTWTLYRGADTIADSAGMTMIGAGVTVANGDDTVIRIDNQSSASSLYALTGSADSMYIESTSKTLTAVNVSDMSNNYGYVGFLMYDTGLTVPEYLPPHLTDLSLMFEDCRNFNQDLSMWNLDNVINTDSMFANCTTFNQDLSGWNMGSVEVMDYMFQGCTAFNQDLSMWDVSSVPFIPPNDFDGECVNWTLPKPVWGTNGVANGSKPTYLAIDISGASGTYLTISKNGGADVTFNLADPAFDAASFDMLIASGQSGMSIAFAAWPVTNYDDVVIGPDKTPGICGMFTDGKIATPNHPNGFTMNSGIQLGEMVIQPPYYVTSEVNVLTIKPTPSAPAGQDIFDSLAGGKPITSLSVMSRGAIELA